MSSSNIAVVIPSYMRPERLVRCLSALAESDEKSFSVVVVDDGSTPPLRPHVEPFTSRMNVICLRQDNRGPAAARNKGVEMAEADIVAFTDDDCCPDPSWLSKLREGVEREPQALVGGVTRNALETDIFAETSQDLVSFLYEYAGRDTDGLEFFTSNNMACRKDCFLEMGGFDATFPLAGGEDRDFGLRWRDRGRPLRLIENAVVHHYHGMTLSGFMRQHRNYGRGARQLHGRLDHRGDGRPKFKGASFYQSLLSYPIREKRPHALTRSTLLLMSQVAMVAGYAMEMAAPKQRP
ncbi:MAG: glycosyltransferase [Parvularcula sp.]|nr:glycosyltransferase [Parvularcula sp.]